MERRERKKWNAGESKTNEEKNIVKFDTKRVVCAYLLHFVIIYASLCGLMPTHRRVGSRAKRQIRVYRLQPALYGSSDHFQWNVPRKANLFHLFFSLPSKINKKKTEERKKSVAYHSIHVFSAHGSFHTSITVGKPHTRQECVCVRVSQCFQNILSFCLSCGIRRVCLPRPCPPP